MKKYCCDCKKKIDNRSTRCRPCNSLFLKQFNKKYYCIDCKKEIDYYKSKRCRECWNKLPKVPWNKGMKINNTWNKGKKCPYQQGKNHYNWKGGKTIQMGYVYVLSSGHPKARVSKKNPTGYVAEHVLVMEKKLGRYLQGKECVHHIDFDKKIIKLVI